MRKKVKNTKGPSLDLQIPTQKKYHSTKRFPTMDLRPERGGNLGAS
jgi:hypothetical protein